MTLLVLVWPSVSVSLSASSPSSTLSEWPHLTEEPTRRTRRPTRIIDNKIRNRKKKKKKKASRWSTSTLSASLSGY